MRNYSRAFVFSVCLLLLVLVPFAVARGGFRRSGTAHDCRAGAHPGGAQGADISIDGQTIVFSSVDDEIVMNDTNGKGVVSCLV